MADPKGINPPTPHANTGSAPPSPNISTQPKDEDQENTTTLKMNTAADLKKMDIHIAPKQPFPQPKIELIGFIPRSFLDLARKAVKELNLPEHPNANSTDHIADIFFLGQPQHESRPSTI